jgi:hypothetical protein
MARGLSTLEKSEVEGHEYQDNSDIRHQPLPKSVSEKQQADADNGGNQCHDIKRQYNSCHRDCPIEYLLF